MGAGELGGPRPDRLATRSAVPLVTIFRTGTMPGEERLALWIACTLTIFYCLTSSGRPRVINEHSLYWMTESVVLFQSLAVPQALPTGYYYGKVARNGLPYTPYGPGYPLLAAPFVAAAYAGGHALLDPPWSIETTARWFATWASAASTGIALGLLFLVYLELGAAPRAALAAIALLAFGTYLWPYATYFFNEPGQVLCLTAGLLALLRTLRGQESAAWSAGLALGWMVLIKASTLLIALPLLALLATRPPGRRRGPLWRFLVPFVACGVAYGAYNAWRYGSPFDMGYVWMDDGKVGSFQGSLPAALWGLTLSPGKGFLLFAPPATAGLLAWPAFHRRHRPLSRAALAAMVATVGLFLKFTWWEGGYCLGPRFLLPLVPLAALPLPFCLQCPGRLRQAALGLGVLGIALQLLFVSTSFLEHQAAGVGRDTWQGNAYYDGTFTYKWDYNAPREHFKLLIHHLSALIDGDGLPPQGLGLDLWWFYLAQAAESAGRPPPWRLLAALAGLQVLLLVVSAARLRRHARSLLASP